MKFLVLTLSLFCGFDYALAEMPAQYTAPLPVGRISLSGRFELKTLTVTTEDGDDSAGNPIYKTVKAVVEPKDDNYNDLVDAKSLREYKAAGTMLSLIYDPDTSVTSEAGPCIGEDFTYPDPKVPTNTNGICYYVTPAALIEN